MYDALKDNLAKAIYKKNNKLVIGVNGDIIQLTQDLIEMISEGKNNTGSFLGIASPSTIPTLELNGFYFSSNKGVYTNFIGRNNIPITINGSLEIIYCIKEDDKLIWVHEKIQIDSETNIEAVSYDDINNIIRN